MATHGLPWATFTALLNVLSKGSDMSNLNRFFVAMVVTMGSIGEVEAEEKFTFRCTFGPGIVANWDEGVVSISPGNFGKPDVTLIFDAIDPVARTGRMIGNAGATDLAVISTSVGTTLVEKTGNGGLVLTTIFTEKSLDNGKLSAVMSRHITFGGPFPSQYYGTCERV